MNVAIVLPYLKAGGTERQASYIANFLQDKGHSVTVVSIEKKGGFSELFDTDINFLNIPFKKNNLFKIVYRLKRLIDRKEIDLVLSRAWNTNMIAMLAAKISNIPFVLFLSSSVELGDQFFVKRKLYSYCLKEAQKIISVSQASKKNCKYWLGVDGEKINVIHNGIDIKDINDQARDTINDYAEKAGVELVFVGRLIHRKGLDLVFDALTQIPEDINFNLKILGKGPKLKEYQEEIEKKGVEGKVQFLGEKVNPFPYVNNADIFLLPSRSEGFPNALLEAMALGKTVIAADCNNGPREVVNGENGTLVPVDDSKAIAEAILFYIKNPDIAIQHGENALDTISGDFRLQSQLIKIEDVLKSALEEF